MPKLPSHRGYSSASQGIVPEWIEKRRAQIGAEWHQRKRECVKRFGRKTLERKARTDRCFGPFELPLNVFTSSRWHEQRTRVPLPKTRDDWHFIWQWWRHAKTYKDIKIHIEEFGMRQPIHADWYVNYNPEESRLVHRCFSHNLGNLDFPFLILRTGNERLLMAMFEWGWETITTLVFIRDCGHSRIVSAMLKEVADLFGTRNLWINRPVSDKGLS